jgi:bifunctional non-homologous end joining protein LigD
MPNKVPAYQAKRDFKKTQEPSGDLEVRPPNFLRVVIQKHDATGLHHDLRLELDGVFKSCAVSRARLSTLLTSGRPSRWKINP